MRVTIDPEAIISWTITVGYPVLKIVSSWYITRQEFRFPVWNKDGVQVERRLHHLITAYIRNFTVNPEWAVAKLIAFVPIWLLSGLKYWDTFCPWRVRKVPPICKQCNDTGWYATKSFVKGAGKTQNQCGCERVHVNDQIPSCHCMVCLDKENVGPNRPCPHCERKKRVAEAEKNFWTDEVSAQLRKNLSQLHKNLQQYRDR